MANLAENIGRAVSDFDSMKTAIESRGVTVGNAPTSEYAKKIEEIQSEIYFNETGQCYTENVTIPANVIRLNNNAFSNCVNMKRITIPNTVQTIGQAIILGCSKVEFVSIDTSTIPYQFADGCRNLKSVELKENIQSINSYAFRNCVNLSNLVLPQNLTSIGASAFQSCRSLNGTLKIPKHIKTIYQGAFQGCTNIDKIEFENESELESLYAFVFSGTVISEIKIPHGTKNVYTQAFSGVSKLETIYIPNTIITPFTSSTAYNVKTIKNIYLENDFDCDGCEFSAWDMSHDILIGILNALKDNTGLDAKTLILGATNLAKLTEEQKQIATNKNWNLA